jgi:hypothetical protein
MPRGTFSYTTGMRIHALTLLIAALLGAASASASERCDISYSVRLVAIGHDVDTGSETRSFSACVKNLTACHTDAEKLAREHARNTPSALGSEADPSTVSVLDVDTGGACEDDG